MASATVSELYLACRNGDIATVDRLLPRTPVTILNSLEANGSTCLHAASYNGHADIVARLLAHGACRTIRNRYGCTALDEAKTDEVANLFPRSTDAKTKRFSDNPAKQTEWNFEQGDAEAFSRAFHWGCIKDRGLKKTVEKVRKADVLIDDDGEKSMKLVQHYFDLALKKNDPTYLLRAYTVESRFYNELNRYMATGSSREVFEKLCKTWSGYYTGIIIKNPAFEPYRFSGETYRGMELTPADFSQYRTGVALTNKAFQSTSKSWKIAKGFACPSTPKAGRIGVIITLTITDRKSALSIDDMSEYEHEEEVLIMPGTFFIVTDIQYKELPYEIQLRQLEWNDEF